MIPHNIKSIINKSAELLIITALSTSGRISLDEISYSFLPEHEEDLKHVADLDSVQFILDNPQLVAEFAAESIQAKLSYFEREGFVYKQNKEYVLYTPKEIEQELQSIYDNA